jgi:chromate transporter
MREFVDDTRRRVVRTFGRSDAMTRPVGRRDDETDVERSGAVPVSSVTSATNARARDDADADADAMDDARDGRATMGEIATAFALMGWTAFGGPAAHVGLFDKTFVSRDEDDEDEDEDEGGGGTPRRRAWMTRGVFSELLALGQCMPGPTSTQMSFAIGTTQRGVMGGLTSGGLFQYPGLILMTLAGTGAAEALVNPSKALRAFTAGVSAAGVGLVVSAADGLARSQGGKTRVTKMLCATSAVVAYYHRTAWLFPSLIVFGGVVTAMEARWKKRKEKTDARSADVAAADRDAEDVAHLGLKPWAGAALIAAWIVTLITLGIVVSNTSYESNKELHWFEAFWRTGSIIFGGGQVVLPLLLNDVVQYDTTCSARDAVTNACTAYAKTETATSWITEEQFFAGLGVVQAMPGPLFNLSAYIGAVAAKRAGVNVIVGVMCCWFGLFGPGVMLIFAVLPFWGKFRKWDVYKRALPGLNASAVGLVVAAVFSIAFKVKDISPFPNASVCIGLICTFCAHVIKLPPGTWSLIQAPLVVVLGGLLGLIAHGAEMN